MMPDPGTDPLFPDYDPPPEGVAADDPSSLRQKAAERDQYLDRLQRTMAEFQNYKARVAKEKTDIRKFATSEILRSLLPALDNLERATSGATASDEGPLLDGVRMVIDQFVRALEQLGVSLVVTDGVRFDPEQMEAVARIETDEADENAVLDVFEKGYRFDDLMIRPARVTVAAPKKPE